MPKPARNFEVYQISLPPAVLAAADRAAEERYETRSQVIRRWLIDAALKAEAERAE